MKALIVFNPTAHSGKAEGRWGEINQISQSLGLEVERLDTLPSGKTRQVIADRVKDREFPLVIGVGGDGTQTEVVQGIMLARDRYAIPLDESPTFCPIPIGTANNIAKSLQLDSGSGIEHALTTAAKGKDLVIDLGRVDGIYFADSFTIGFDPAILVQRNVDRETVSRIPLIKNIIKDYFLYFISGVKKVFTHKPLEATVSIDGQFHKFPNLYNLVVNNTNVYAGILDFQKRPSQEVLQDGLLDLIFCVGRSEYMSKFMLGIRAHPVREEHMKKVMVKHTRNLQGKSIVINLAHPILSLIDGEEYLTKERYEITAVPKALRVKVPEGFAGR